MGYLSERISYIRGLADGLELGEESKEAKVISAMIELLDDMAFSVEELEEQQDLINEDLDMATHRVIEIDAENQHFYTKGDANDAADGAPVHFNNLVGKPLFSIPKLGYISDWVTNPPGMYLVGAGLLIYLILMFVPDVLKKAEEADRRAEEKKKAQQEKIDV